MVAASLQQFVLEGEFGEIAKPIVVIFLGIAVDDVEWLLLSFVYLKSLKSLPSLHWQFHSLHIPPKIGLCPISVIAFADCR